MVGWRKKAEIIIGVLYASGAASQALFTLGDSKSYFGDMADRAWLGPAESLVGELLVPNSVIVTVLLVIFQATVAVAILRRGSAVRPALLAGGVFSIVGALTGSPAETVGYGALAAVHFRLAAAR